MQEDYKENVKAYLKISSGTRAKLTALSVTVIGAIFFFVEYGAVDVVLLKLAFVFYILTIMTEIISGYLKSQHYALWIDGRIISTDFRKSKYGMSADFLFWVSGILFLAGSVLFIIGIF